MTGKAETHPNKNVKNMDKKNNPVLSKLFIFNFMNANNPATQPGINATHMKERIKMIKKMVMNPNKIHRMKEMYPVHGIPSG